MTSASANDAKVSTAALVILAILTAINRAILVEAVPLFQREYMDKLPCKPLPQVTLFVLHYRRFLAAFDASILLAASACAAFRDPNAKWIAHYGMAWNALQTGIVGVALYMPTVPMTTPM
jgi:hypothetical protein